MYLTVNILIRRNGLDFIYLSMVLVVGMIFMDIWTILTAAASQTYLTTANDSNAMIGPIGILNFYIFSMILYGNVVLTGLVYACYLLSVLQCHSQAKGVLGQYGADSSHIKSMLTRCCCCFMSRITNRRSFGGGSLSGTAAAAAAGTSAAPSTNNNQKKTLTSQQLSKLQNIKARGGGSEGPSRTSAADTGGVAVYNPLLDRDTDSDDLHEVELGHISSSSGNYAHRNEYQALPTADHTDSSSGTRHSRSNNDSQDADTITL
jgi:hypothetical protein